MKYVSKKFGETVFQLSIPGIILLVFFFFNFENLIPSLPRYRQNYGTWPRRSAPLPTFILKANLTCIFRNFTAHLLYNSLYSDCNSMKKI